MKLQEWIDSKCKELVDSKIFKEMKFRSINNCKVSSHFTSVFFELGNTKPIDVNIEVEEIINRRSLLNEIDAFEINFNVVKPRCRKSEMFSLIVKPI